MIDEQPPSEFERELTRALSTRANEGREAGQWRADVMWARFVDRWRREEGRQRRPRLVARDLRERVSKLGTRPLRGGMAGFGTRTLWRWMWSFGSIAALVAAFFFVQHGSSPTLGITRRYTTGVNQQGIVTLSDGTRVTLAPQTTLWVDDFSARHRAVTVDGKAYFEVSHVSGAPFEVRSGTATTRVLGTAFLFEHAPSNTHVRVAVAEGKVRLSSTTQKDADVMVTAGYVGEILDSVATVHAVVDSALNTEWLDGQLVFYNVPVAAVLQTLTRWYGYQFRYTDSTLLRRDVTVAVSVQSSASALSTLEQILKVNLSVTGDTVTLTPRTDRRGSRMPRVRTYDIWTPTNEVGR